MLKYYAIICLVGIGLVLIGLICIRIITSLDQLQKVENEGRIVVAYIIKRNPGLNKISIRYQVGSISYEKDLRVSNTVYEQYLEKDQIEIKVLNENPTIITWQGNRLLQSSILNLILLVFGGTLISVVFFFGIFGLRR